METIESALTDPEIVPLKRAELAIKWLTLIKESVTQAAAPTPEVPRVIPLEMIKRIREQVYGIYDADPKLPNTPVETSD
ncbi:hypothetical protein LQF76_12545 [Gloeomargaritales cyanobacterium VI4D9]|nr:hypothetical protein LQF76_12545 [Gloeomargaritales cyanobacterium VI4D9]